MPTARLGGGPTWGDGSWLTNRDYRAVLPVAAFGAREMTSSSHIYRNGADQFLSRFLHTPFLK
jgi:hypothetical protein